MNINTTVKPSSLATALLMVGAMATTSAQAVPFSAKVLAGLSKDSLVTVGTLDFEIAQGDGSVRPFDYGRALGDGSVRKSGDGSVRSCDGSVMPADGACASPVDLGGFDFAGTFDLDPSVLFSLSATNITSSPLLFIFQFTAPFAGGPYNTLATDLTGTGTAESIVMSGLLDANIVADATISCSSPAACADPVASLSPLSNASGLFGVKLSFTLPPGANATTSFNGSAILSEVTSQAVSEPATVALFGLGLLGAGVSRRRRVV